MSVALGHCNQKLYTTLDIVMGEGGAVLVPVQVNGKEAWMGLFMGSGASMIFESAIAEFGLNPTRVDSGVRISFAGKSVTTQVKINQLLLGRADYR